MMLLCGLGWERRGDRKRKKERKKTTQLKYSRQNELVQTLASKGSCSRVHFVYHLGQLPPLPLR